MTLRILTTEPSADPKLVALEAKAHELLGQQVPKPPDVQGLSSDERWCATYAHADAVADLRTVIFNLVEDLKQHGEADDALVDALNVRYLELDHVEDQAFARHDAARNQHERETRGGAYVEARLEVERRILRETFGSPHRREWQRSTVTVRPGIRRLGIRRRRVHRSGASSRTSSADPPGGSDPAGPASHAGRGRWPA